MFNKIYEKTVNYIKENYKFLIVVVGIVLLFKIPLNYAIYTPGGSINLNNRIEINNDTKTKGSFNMAYVKMLEGNIPFLLLSYIVPNWDITSLNDIKFEDESVDQMNERDHIYLEESIANATIAAFSLTEQELVIKDSYNKVVYVSKDAKTDLKFGDIILKANNKEITSIDDYKAIVENASIGDKISLQIKRNKEVLDLDIKVIMLDDEKKTGISFVTLYDIKTTPQINIKTKTTESGPSGGIMLALGIYNKIISYDLTKGRKIVGTGTIEATGEVGEIGGVKYKVLGAIRDKADVFIAPDANCADAKSVIQKKKSNMKLICVESLNEAIYELS